MQIPAFKVWFSLKWLIFPFVYLQLKSIADYKNVKTDKLYMRCREDVCKFLVEAMHDSELRKLDKSAENILLEVSNVLGFSDVKSFLSVSSHFPTSIFLKSTKF